MSLIKHTKENIKKTILENIIVTDSGCWEWQRYKNRQGYGRLNRLGESLAHRVSFIVFYGPISSEMCVLHKCDNPACVNPEHFFLGTIQDNNRDCKEKQRLANQNTRKTHCKRGHDLADAKLKKTKYGIERRCRICTNIIALAAHHRKKKSL